MKRLLLVLIAVTCGLTLSGQNHLRTKAAKTSGPVSQAANVISQEKFNSFTVSPPVVYTNEADFLAAIGSKNYLEDFNSYTEGSINQPSVTLTSGQFSYSITAPVDDYIYSVDGAISTNFDMDTLVFTNKGRHINYFGARFYTLDIGFNFVASPMSIVVGDYTYTFNCTDQVSFLGFVFTDSIPNFGVVGNPAGYAWPTVDHLYVGDNKNYPPEITSTGTVTTAEDTPVTLSLSNLTYKDVDIDDPMSLVIQNGENYSFEGTTVTPAADFNGTLHVGVKVSDGIALSEIGYITVNVTPVNDPPVITSTKELTTDEDTPVTIKLSDLTITDVDGDNTFTFNVLNGDNYSVSGTTVTPASNFNGVLSVGVTASDGTATSATAYIKVTVNPVNDPPVLIFTIPATTPEDTPVTLDMSNVIAIDVDGDNLSLVVQSGTGYTFSGNTVTPSPDFNGVINVAVKVTDGTAFSGVGYVTVTVTPVNDAPVITSTGTLTTAEDTPVTITLSDVTVSDVDGDTSFSLSVQAGTDYTFSGNTVTPAADFNGTLQVAVRVSDGTDLSAPAYVTVDVTPVNDAPVITATNDLITNEDTPVTLTLSDITVTDVDGDNLTLIVLTGDEYTFSGTTITPSHNFAGTIYVPVKVFDGTVYSNAMNVRITVLPVNDAPVIISTTAVTTPEDTPVTLTLTDITATDAESDPLTIQVQAGDHYTFSGATVTPAPDFNGDLDVSFRVFDGTDYSETGHITVTVTPVNDPPVISATQALTTPEDTPITISLTDVTVTDVDGDTSFELSLLDGSNYTVSGNTVTPQADYNGILQVGVQVSDGIASSAVAYIQITVTPVNDAPVITSTPPVTAIQGTLYTYNVAATDVDNTTLTYSLSGQPAGMSITDNVINWTPGTGVTTSGEITVTVSDGSLTATQSFTIAVSPQTGINDPEADSFTISPNPATDIVKISANFTIRSVQVIDITGKVIRTETSDDSFTTIDVGDLSKGFYFIKVKSDSFTKVKKLIKL